MSRTNDFAAVMRENRKMDLKERLGLVLRLSTPAILSQITEIMMQYIDAAMVGSLGAAASASIGLVSSSTWLTGGLMMAAAAGFSVQAAHAVGAGDIPKTKSLFRQSLVCCALFAAVLVCIGVPVSAHLPQWLKADPEIWHNAEWYFKIFCFFIPVRQFCYLGMQMLQRSGDMKTPGICAALACVLDVVFNFLLIFPSRIISVLGMNIPVFGAGLGVAGAQLGTSLSMMVSMFIVYYCALFRSDRLCLIHEKGSWKPQGNVISEAMRIGVPMALEQSALCLAQIVSTGIVAPLGTAAIAANSFAITAESVCYMPGYGISSAATTIVGQAIGAKRKDLAESFAWLTTFTGVALMTAAGIVMYFLCPYVFAFLTPDLSVRELGVQVLRIELLAEPLFAASIVATGALRGAGDTLIPGILNLVSIWGVRLTLGYYLTPRIGLKGMWIAMAVELCFRGILFLIRMKRGKWLESIPAEA